MPPSKSPHRRSSFQWLVDLDKESRESPPTKFEVKEEGVDLCLERISFGQYAAVHLTYVDCKESYRIAPTHQASEQTGATISFQIALSGSARGSLPRAGEFSLDKTWGFVTDFSEGEADIMVDSAEPLRSFGGTLALEQIEALFAGERFEGVFENASLERGILQPFLVTSAMRGLVADALASPLIGPLRQLYLEGVVLQIFALIFQGQLDRSTPLQRNGKEGSGDSQVIEMAAELLVRDLAHPPSLLGLSEATGLGVRKISEGFREVFDSSVVDFLVAKRMQSARDLLREMPDYPIKALSAEMGYQHVSNFTRAFTNKFGISPAAYAKGFRREKG